MTRTRRFVAASCLLAGLAGAWHASAQEPASADGKLLVYHCHNLTVITVRAFPRRVEVTTETRKATLPELTQPGAVRYSDGTVSLSALEDTIRLEEPGAVYFCRSAPVEVPWEDAKLRGIEFRAVGENPPWLLEIDAGVAMTFSTGAGPARETLTFPSAPRTGTDERTTWTTRSGTHTLTIVAERRVCHHAGSTMTLEVTANIDGKTYRGCGRSLASAP